MTSRVHWPAERLPTTRCVWPCCSFDLIFLDANKDGYQAYYDIIMRQQLLAPSGILVVDNTLMKVIEQHPLS